jgi:hypothetical protein
LGYWQKVDASVQGVPMIRPIIGKAIPVQVSVPNIEKKEVFYRIYPNPTNGEFHIESKDELAEVEVTDIFGRAIVSGADYSFDLSEFSAGTYYVRILFKNGEQKSTTIIKSN